MSTLKYNYNERKINKNITLVAEKNGRSTINASVVIRVCQFGASSKRSPIAEITWFAQLSDSIRFFAVNWKKRVQILFKNS